MRLKIIEEVSKYAKLSEACTKDVLANAHQETFSKGVLLQESGKVCTRLFFIDSGLVRMFFYDADGKDITYQFYGEGTFTSILNSYASGTPSLYNIETLEECTIYSIYFTDFARLREKHPELEKVHSQVLLQILVQYDHRATALQFMSAEERYLDLLKTQPSIINRANLGQIASYLGINQATLSRIRSKAK